MAQARDKEKVENYDSRFIGENGYQVCGTKCLQGDLVLGERVTRRICRNLLWANRLLRES